MKLIVTLIILCILPLTNYCQVLFRKANYFDEKGKLYKIEQAYKNAVDSSICYTAHYKDGSVCIKRKEFFRGDTLIIQEDYFNIQRKKTKLELYSEDFTPFRTSSANGDSVKIIFHSASYNGATGELNYPGTTEIGDTLLVGTGIKKFDDLLEKFRNDKVSLILCNEIQIKTDSLLPIETSKAYFIENVLLKVESNSYSSRNDYYIEKILISKNKLVGEMYWFDFGPHAFLTDTIKWNDSHTEIEISKISYEEKEHYLEKSRFLINKNNLSILNGDTVIKQIEYLKTTPSLYELIIDNILYFDLPTDVALRWFERPKIKKIIYPDGKVHEYKYKHNKQKEIIETVEYFDKKLLRKIVYE